MAGTRTTFLRGHELVNVAGESHYQDALRQITGGQEGSIRQDTTAHLIAEPENPYDPNAVRVEIEGKKVGYLPRTVAGDYGPLLEPITARRRVAACEALVAGDSSAEASSLGVFLRLPPAGGDGEAFSRARR